MRVLATSRGCKRSVVTAPEVAPAKKLDAARGLGAVFADDDDDDDDDDECMDYVVSSERLVLLYLVLLF